jgi:hypothetical protein
MVVMVVMKITTTHYYPILPIEHLKKSPSVPPEGVARAFRDSITGYYYLLHQITTNTSNTSIPSYYLP